MIKMFLILVVVCLVVAGAAYWRLTSVVKEEPKKEVEAVRVEEEQQEQAIEEVKELVPGIRLLPSNVNSPVLETEEGSYRVGNLVAAGEVRAVKQGVARVEWRGETSYDVTTANATITEIGDVCGRVSTDEGLEAIMLRDGDVLRAGRRCRRGFVERLSEDRADIRRQDGGWLFVCFNAVPQEVAGRFEVGPVTAHDDGGLSQIMKPSEVLSMGAK